MKSNNYIWYLCYGSNLNYNRFKYYIQGGYCEFNGKTYSGCSDKTLPLKDKAKIINYEMYFAKHSKYWENGGVCFLKIHEDLHVKTYGRMYLITYEQFLEVCKQEGLWYQNKLSLGEEEDNKIYSFTNKVNLLPTKPGNRYLNVIKEGLMQSYPMLTEQTIKDYLSK
jgi:5-methylcytosine-specific restriction protein A